MNIKLSGREKNALLMLIIILLGFVYYTVVYSNLMQKVEEKKAKYNSLSAELSRLDMIIGKYNANKAEIEKAKRNYYNLKDVIPPNQDIMMSVVDLKFLLEKVKITTTLYMFEPAQKVEMEEAKKIGENFYPYFLTTRQTWNCDYMQIHALLNEQKKFKPLYKVDSISILKTDKNLNVTAVLKFYGFADPNSPPRTFNLQKTIKVMPTGKKNIFQ